MTVSQAKTNQSGPRKPEWLKIKLVREQNFDHITKALRKRELFTVCEEARCPNINECWNGGTATFMLLGGVCTRGCRFCSVSSGNPNGWIDEEEPIKTADSVSEMDLDYIVLTSVDRDDLPDGGASHFARTVKLVKEGSPGILVETLTPDWRGDKESIRIMAESEADVLAHNVETVERLQSTVRDPRAGYAQSLMVLEQYLKQSEAAGRKAVTKSSLMLGVGEEEHEVRQAMQDMLDVGVRILTLGQYLQPTRKHLPVKDYIHPDRFEEWAREGEAMGFDYVAAGPLVRSSYRAGEYFIRKVLGRG
jgi:lipoic acid synthetase